MRLLTPLLCRPDALTPQHPGDEDEDATGTHVWGDEDEVGDAPGDEDMQALQTRRRAKAGNRTK